MRCIGQVTDFVKLYEYTGDAYLDAVQANCGPSSRCFSRTTQSPAA